MIPYKEFADVAVTEEGPQQIRDQLFRLGISGLVREDSFKRHLGTYQRRYSLGHDNPLIVHRVYLHSREDYDRVSSALGDTFTMVGT